MPGFEEDWIPADHGKGSSIGFGVGSSNIRRPVPLGFDSITPNAGISSPDTRIIDVVTKRIRAIQLGTGNNILCSSRKPVIRAWNGQLGPAVDLGGDDHCFISRKNRLTEGDCLAAFVLCSYGSSSINAVWLAGEGLADLAIPVAVESTILRMLVQIS